MSGDENNDYSHANIKGLLKEVVKDLHYPT